MSDYAVIIAARNSSARLPNKAVVSYCPDGTTNLTQIIRRWEMSRRNPAIVVFTSDAAQDDSINLICHDLSIPCYRTPLSEIPRNDATTPMDNALREYAPDAKYIARGLADNPLVDVGLADWRYDVMCETGADSLYYGGDESRITYAGTTDIYSRSAWDRMVRASIGEEREHPGKHFWDNIAKYSAVSLPLPPREYLAPVRTELDTPDDLAMFTALWSSWKNECGGTIRFLDTLIALDFIISDESISSINAHIEAKTQSKPSYGRGAAFVCRECRRRTGTVDAGNLVVRCGHCGRPQKFYSKPPAKPSRMGY